MAKKTVRVFLLSRRVALAVGAVLAAAAIFGAVHIPAAVSAAGTARQLPIYSVERPSEEGEKFCAISFDAAWGNEDTQMLLDILARYDVKATFFLVGDWVDKYPESVKALGDAGMEVMNHSNHHDHFNRLTADEIVADVTACNDKVKAITGIAPTLIRCPYGEYDDHVISAIRSMGMEPIQWDVDSLDWKNLSAEKIATRVIGKTKSGSIILCHNNGLHTAESLPLIFSALKEKGFEFVPVGELIYRENYEIRRDGTQVKSGE